MIIEKKRISYLCGRALRKKKKSISTRDDASIKENLDSGNDIRFALSRKPHSKSNHYLAVAMKMTREKDVRYDERTLLSKGNECTLLFGSITLDLG